MQKPKSIIANTAGGPIVLVLAFLVGCSSRSPQPIDTTPPPVQKNSNGAIIPDAGASPSPRTGNPDQYGPSPSPTPSTSPDPGAAVPSSGGGGAGGNTNLQVNPILGGDTSGTTLNWDGKSFKGNDKWDIVPN